MSDITDIQWADTTVNPIMGCGGCELFPSPGKVLAAIDAAVAGVGVSIGSRAIYKELINGAYGGIHEPKPGHKNAVNTTNIWHLRELFLERVDRDHGKEAAEAANIAIRQSITCYAATLHLNKGQKLLSPDYGGHKGYAPIFESVTRFEGRAEKVAKLDDLLGRYNPATPWKGSLPRLIFVSDMGDALSTKADFPFLKTNLMPAMTSEDGRRHLWLWLTKRPGNMAQFADDIGGFPENVCAMTTLTGADAESLQRLADLKKVKAHIRGLSIEPLWERIPPSKLKLKGIDWVIVGGESGSGDLTRPLALEWAEELRDHCRKHGVAFFMKQLGRNPSRNGTVFRLKDQHGGEWGEWPDEALKVREFPQAFHDHRKQEMKPSTKLRPVKQPKKKALADVTPEDRDEFKRLDKIVRKGVAAFMECGKALIKIQEKKLWRAGGWLTWEAYCIQVAGLSKSYAHRLINATRVALELPGELPNGNAVMPVSESQVRPLLKLGEAEQKARAWAAAVEKAEGGQPTATVVEEVVFEILHPDGPGEKPVSRSQRRVDLVGRIRKVVATRKSWEQVETLLAELEEML
jgi:protein gp37